MAAGTSEQKTQNYATISLFQMSWVLSEKERDRRYNKLKKVGFRNGLLRSSISESPDRQISLPAMTSVQTPEIHVR